jgi:AcrR family transcriptional regulator
MIETMSKMQTATVRNRPATERRLKHAVEKLLARGGFGVLGPSAVAREAGVDKMLIYRYFGDLDGLLTAVVKSPGFFPSIEEICDGDVAAMRARPLPERAATLARNYARALIDRPVVLAMMAWETVERNKLTAITETEREGMSLRIAELLLPDVANLHGIAGAMALIGAAVNYLAIRQRKIRIFSSVNIRTEAGWRQLADAIEIMMRSFAADHNSRSTVMKS